MINSLINDGKDVLNSTSLQEKLGKNGIDLPVYVNIASSTNTEAKKIYNDKKSQFLYVAPTQTQGRGRVQRSFVSNEGGIYMTLCYIPQNLKVTDSLKIVLLTGLAVAKVLNKYVENVSIKWPNDVFVNNKKICGILLESVISECVTQALFLGIGVNVFNEIPENLQDVATTLKLEGVKSVLREDLIIQIISLLFDMLKTYQNCGFEPFLQEYTQLSRTINHDVVVNANGVKKYGFAVGLSEEGYLLLKNDGKTEKIILGDIEV